MPSIEEGRVRNALMRCNLHVRTELNTHARHIPRGVATNWKKKVFAMKTESLAVLAALVLIMSVGTSESSDFTIKFF